jgi:hypothetical protein
MTKTMGRRKSFVVLLINQKDYGGISLALGLCFVRVRVSVCGRGSWAGKGEWGGIGRESKYQE